jgi:hypothetical protein
MTTEASPRPKRKRREKNKTGLTDLTLRRMTVKNHNDKRREQHLKDGRPMEEFKEVKQFLIWDSTAGLSVLISAGGTKTFRSTYKLNGQFVTRTLGRFDSMVPNADPNKVDVQISKAREMANNDRALVKEGRAWLMFRDLTPSGPSRDQK